MCSPLTLWCRWPCYCWVIMKVLAPTWRFLISPWRCYWDTSLQPYKGGGLAFQLTLVCYVWRWCLAGVVQLFSKSFFLAQLSFSWFFGYRDQAFVRANCLCLLPFPSFQFLQLQIWSIWGKKKAQGTHHCVFLCIARFLADQPSSLYLLECYYAWFTHNVQGF